MKEDRVAERYSDVARAVLAREPRLGAVRFVAVDGPAGSGKSTFAGRLAAALRADGATVAEIHTDDLLEGWTDIESFWPRLLEQILEPLSRGEQARYQRYDWDRRRFYDEWDVVAVPDVLLVEGVTSARRASRPYWGLGVYVHAPRDVRLERGVARDGEALRDQWVRWMVEEDRHFAAEETVRWVDILADGSPIVPHDRDCEFVRLPQAP